ncbi:MAG TPA: CsbD family protein [Candidatus Xenobia bacterium]
MHKDEIIGKGKEELGKMQEKMGEELDSPMDVEAGQEKQVEGKMQNMKGQVKDFLHKKID